MGGTPRQSEVIQTHPISAWFKNAGFGVTVLVDLAAIGYGGFVHRVQAGHVGLVTAESFETEHLEPMRMAITCEQLGRTFSDTLGYLASLKTAVIKKESQ